MAHMSTFFQNPGPRDSHETKGQGYIYLIDPIKKSTIHEGKYTIPMDPSWDIFLGLHFYDKSFTVYISWES